MLKSSFILLLTMLSLNVGAQDGLIRRFLNLRYPEKIWAVTHPFVVRKAFRISSGVLKVTNEMIKNPELDGDFSGGQVDAFRHGLWMASLTQAIGARKAYRLGVAHEKCNRIDFEKRVLEEAHLPDSISSAMDLNNNKVGIEIGKQNPKASQTELIEIVKKAVLEGKFVVIKKDTQGNFLDWQDKVIENERLLGKWFNDKILVPSNSKRK